MSESADLFNFNSSDSSAATSCSIEPEELTDHDGNDNSLADESIESINKSPSSLDSTPKVKRKETFQLRVQDILNPLRQIAKPIRKSPKITRKLKLRRSGNGISTNNSRNKNNNENMFKSPLSSSYSSSQHVFPNQQQNVQQSQLSSQSPPFSPLRIARELLKYSEDMMAIALPSPNTVIQQGNSISSPQSTVKVGQSDIDINWLGTQQTSIIESQKEGLQKLDSIIGLAQTFSQMEKEKLVLKKRKLVLQECHQKEILAIEREKLDLEREKLEFKKLKMVSLQSENLVPPTKHYWVDLPGSDTYGPNADIDGIDGDDD